MSYSAYSENTQILRGVTDNDDFSGPVLTAQLYDDLGAPWEIYIKSVSSDSSQWGNATYSTYAEAAGSQAARISISEGALIGNAIHRILKYYLEDSYLANNIETVRLSISFKTNILVY